MYRLSCTHADIWFRSKVLANLTQWCFGTKLVRDFFPKEFCISFLDALICYVQVFMHASRHLIQVKSLGQSNPVVFWFKIGARFFSKRILHFFLGCLNMLCTSFHARMPTFDLGQKPWPIKPSRVLVQNWCEIFLQKNFAFLSWTS